MNESNTKEVTVKSAASAQVIMEAQLSQHYIAYIGLDTHKDTIAVAVAESGRANPKLEGEIANKSKSIKKLIQRLSERYDGQMLLFCYEAGPCGYEIYRQIVASGHDCHVIAPSLVPIKAAEKIKTDNRDAVKLAKYLRSGDLTAIWIPDQEQESMRDLTRARADMKTQELKARQQLSAFVLRHAHNYPTTKTRWTKTHYHWLESIKFEQPLLQVVLQEYIDAAKAATQRVVTMTEQMMEALKSWSMAPVVHSLVALRGIDKHSAMVLLAELGNIRRFQSPRQLMAFLGLVPGEHSSGNTRRQTHITRTGNTHARRILVESAWCYRFPARQTRHIKSKCVNATEAAKAIAWKAQKRLCGRYRTLTEKGKNTKLVCVAIARELIGFVWDIVCHEMLNLPIQKHQAT